MGTIIADSRESRSPVAELLRALGVDVLQQELEVGDYVLAEGFGVERKTAADFVLSIFDRRLFLQATLLKQSYQRCAIIVEGDLEQVPLAITPEALAGALSYLTVLEDIPILQTTGASHTALMMATMRRHAVEGLGYDIALRGGKPKHRDLQAQYLVEGLPGVGPTGASALLDHFKTPLGVFTAGVEQLCQAKGIGPKTASTIVEVLNVRRR